MNHLFAHSITATMSIKVEPTTDHDTNASDG